GLDPPDRDLYELPHRDLAGERPSPAGARQLCDGRAGALGARARSARLRLLQPQRPRHPRGRLRQLPRPDRQDGRGLPGGADQHGLVPRLPSESGSESAARRIRHVDGLGPQRGPGHVRRAARGSQQHQSSYGLFHMPSMKPEIAGKTGRAYWRSLEEYARTEEFARMVQREFPSVAPEALTEATRRDFLKLMGASLAMAGLTGCSWPEERILPFTNRPEGRL